MKNIKAKQYRNFDDDFDIEKLSKKVFKNAFKEAQKNNLPIVKKINDKIFKIYPNGEKEFIKDIDIVKVTKKSFKINL